MTVVEEVQLRTPPHPERLWRAVWDRTGFRPYNEQEAILLHAARHKVWAGGRRVGKSRVGGNRIVPEVFRTYAQLAELRRRGLRREYWIVGPEYSDSEKEFRVVWNALTRLQFPMDHPGSYNNTEAGEMRISLFGETCVIDAKSAKYPGSLVGEGLSGVVFSEAAKLKPSVWWKYLRPTLADFGGWSHFGSTPEGKNWFYDIWMTGQDPDRPDWMSWRTPSWRNPHVYPQGADARLLAMLEKARTERSLEALKRILRWTVTEGSRHPLGIDPEIWAAWQDMPGDLFNQEEAAAFNEYVGRVFKDFDEEVHVVTRGFDPNWQTYACVDYGFTNPFVWLLVQVSPTGDEVHVLAEYYETNRTTEEAAAEIKARGLAPRTVRAFYPDPADPGATRTLSSHLRIPSSNPGALSVADRVGWIRRMLRWGSSPTGTGAALTIERSCVNTIREFGAYRYPETSDRQLRNRSEPENPAKKDDHAPEALGRFFSGRFGPLYGGRTQVRKASVKRGG